MAEKKEKKLKKQKKKREELDDQTTIADMNVEGFDWYNPQKKNPSHQSLGKISRKEYWAMVIGAFRAMWPLFALIVGIFLVMFLIAFIWLK